MEGVDSAGARLGRWVRQSVRSALTGMGPAPGGQNNTNGGDGGAGSWATAPGGVDGATGTTAGGAGGGGAGVVRVYPSQTLGGKVSPPAS